MGGSCGSVSPDLGMVFTTIQSSGARLLHLVNTLLDSSSLRQGTFSLTVETMCLQSVVIESMQVCMYSNIYEESTLGCTAPAMVRC